MYFASSGGAHVMYFTSSRFWENSTWHKNWKKKTKNMGWSIIVLVMQNIHLSVGDGLGGQRPWLPTHLICFETDTVTQARKYQRPWSIDLPCQSQSNPSSLSLCFSLGRLGTGGHHRTASRKFAMAVHGGIAMAPTAPRLPPAAAMATRRTWSAASPNMPTRRIRIIPSRLLVVASAQSNFSKGPSLPPSLRNFFDSLVFFV
jgi:hypothetical protein